MKKFTLIILLLVTACAFVACGKVYNATVIDIDNSINKSLKEFNLLSPCDGEVITELKEFVWERSENAETYTFELCSSADFSSESDVFIRKTGLTEERYTLFANLQKKEQTYYWRVTAINSKGTLVNSNSASFYLDSIRGEVEIPIDDASDWKVHEVGSFAKTSIDNSDFFGNGKPSLCVEFEEENTNQGVGHETSDGWIVVTKSIEADMYGVDAFYFNFYYSGNDSDIFFRVVDEDNEYWHSKIKLASNTKQTVIIKMSEFELRIKGGTTIANQKFDYNHIKYVELVFEKSFGDGFCMISDIKSVNYSDYSHLFISDFDFSGVKQEDFLFENYNFKVSSSDSGGLLLNFNGDIPGYGIAKLVLNKLMVQGDALVINVKFQGSAAANLLIRIIEEDNDRWLYKQPVKYLPEDGKLVIPYTAFTLYNDSSGGDGARQFYYIKQLQFGVSDTYQQGSLSIADMYVSTLESEVENLYSHTVGSDGMIENFNEYGANTELYYVWQNSLDNKDEAMSTDTVYSINRSGKYGVFKYKSDMYAAMYAIRFSGAPKGFKAISFAANDHSVMQEGFPHLKDIGVNPKLTVTIYVMREENTYETYTAVIDKVLNGWYNYNIPFTDFKRDEGFYGELNDIDSENIAGVAFGLSYYYLNADGKANPVYRPKNEVFFDNIKFSGETEYSVKLCITKLMPDVDNADICTVDNFDTYTDDYCEWENVGGQDYSGFNVVDSTLSGGGKCLEMLYKGSESVSYKLHTEFDSSVNVKALTIKIKGDNQAKVYINILFTLAGTSYKVRFAIENLSSEWTKYTIGLDNFVSADSSGQLLSSKRIVNVTDISLGIVNTSGQASAILIDDLQLVNNVVGKDVYSVEKLER